MHCRIGHEIKLTETLSLYYVQNTSNSLCKKGMMCVWEGEITPVLRICLVSGCGCSGDICHSVSKSLRGGYANEWRIPLDKDMDLVLSEIEADGQNLSFDYSLE